MPYLDYPEIVDMHIHLYPDKIAAKAVDTIGIFYDLPMQNSGTFEALLLSGKATGIDHFVVSSTATSPEQVVSINNFMAGLSKLDSRIVSLGTIHPEYSDKKGEIERILSLGLKGLKIHSDFQKYNLDDTLMFPVFEIFEDLKLPVLVHAGDARMEYSSPIRIGRVLDNFPNLTLIAAHLGGYRHWEDSARSLYGRDLYIDTSSSLAFLEKKQAADIIRTHGADRVLFGTDFPMWLQKEELERFMALGLTREENELILYKNSKRLFGI